MVYVATKIQRHQEEGTEVCRLLSQRLGIWINPSISYMQQEMSQKMESMEEQVDLSIRTEQADGVSFFHEKKKRETFKNGNQNS